MTFPRLKTRPRYQDAPRFKLIYAYEDKAKKSYRRHVEVLIPLLAKVMSDYIEKK